MAELQKNHNPAEVEQKWSSSWLSDGVDGADASSGGEPYCIVIPPPNVTGILHMGHALNNTIQDILVRWRRMQGRNAVWVPGTDHAGIATQNVVERALAKQEGKARDDLGRDEFVKRVWEWKEQYGNTITTQLKRLGCSCDWSRERFTMDDGLSNAVAIAFVHLYEKGLIYRGNYIINWCPRCRTALSDEESEHEESEGKLYYVRYAFKDDPRKYITVATTRPETMLGDVAVAVNPGDGRFKELVGKKLILPILNRELVVIADDFVDPAFGTGAVKVTPAHDPNDFEIGRRHDLEQINVMNPDGSMNEGAGLYEGMDRFACRDKLVDDLTKLGVIEKIDKHRNAVGHCYRCATVVEPRLSPQWFVKMKPLAAPAIEAVKQGKVRFVPERWTKVYLEWMENIRDWCISRQIWWGHRIPVFYCDDCGREWASLDAAAKCPACGSTNIRQDEDVLDTWFSSWLWPFGVFGWPEKNDDIKFYYPTHDLVTASEIIFFWVARMIMAGIEFMGDVPFRQVYIHGTVRDDKGRKMSKSLGNSIDPVTVIEEFSADALRFSLMMITATGQDVYLSNDKFEIGRNFATKIWNAARYLQMQSKDFSFEPGEVSFADDKLSPDDQYILAGLHRSIAACNDNLERCRFNDVARVLYEFLWHQYCDWYVEYSKSVLYGDDPAARNRVLRVMHHVFSSAVKLLHPIMPFVTEELWHEMGYAKSDESISRASWPAEKAEEDDAEWGISRATVTYVANKYDLVRVGRTLMADYNVVSSGKVRHIIKPATKAAAKQLEADKASVHALLRTGELEIDSAFKPAKAVPSGVCKLGTVYMPVDDLIDIEVERNRLTKERDKIVGDLGRVTTKLENIDFVQKAPAEVVERQKVRKKELLEKSEKLNRMLDVLAG
ncbi:MAG: valine--tRNA ligase [Lentisphaerales bacterium]|nr:MAG: valine--tRNA ligase [Lentisphaerales bacterium]